MQSAITCNVTINMPQFKKHHLGIAGVNMIKNEDTQLIVDVHLYIIRKCYVSRHELSKGYRRPTVGQTY